MGALSDQHPKHFRSILNDFSHSKGFDALDNDFDEVYMLAAIVGVNRTLKDPFEVIRTNTKLTSNVLEWVAENPVGKILFSSSSEN